MNYVGLELPSLADKIAESTARTVADAFPALLEAGELPEPFRMLRQDEEGRHAR